MEKDLLPFVQRMKITEVKPPPVMYRDKEKLLQLLERRRKLFMAKKQTPCGQCSDRGSDVPVIPPAASTFNHSPPRRLILAEYVAQCAKRKKNSMKRKSISIPLSTSIDETVKLRGSLKKAGDADLSMPTRPKVAWESYTETHTYPLTRQSEQSLPCAEPYRKSLPQLSTPTKSGIRQLFRNITEGDGTKTGVESGQSQNSSFGGIGKESVKTGLFKEEQRISSKYTKRTGERKPKVFLSEKRNSLCPETRVPLVPHNTPEPSYEESVTIIPSLHDIKSQKTLRDILQAMVLEQQNANKNIEGVQAATEKKLEQNVKARIKSQQRAEIYALNVLMAKLEEENFKALTDAKV